MIVEAGPSDEGFFLLWHSRFFLHRHSQWAFDLRVANARHDAWPQSLKRYHSAVPKADSVTVKWPVHLRERSAFPVRYIRMFLNERRNAGKLKLHIARHANSDRLITAGYKTNGSARKLIADVLLAPSRRPALKHF
ncbi:hypothetical protein [Hyphomicrobium sp.]|uniref:hypothetical protein n=1 Tax=Hyphomicrobium sp. TaxID=82 RepID=UPI000FA3A5F7|nr:hypothetical protein [Hyphomicrobium sp.]RUP08072.1 MAG: hypothetical protein EKK38_16135 [Hyphomicrobium sp.]